MNTLAAFAMGVANRDKDLMVFDWDRAAFLIKKKGAKNASAGLSGDWEYTADEIWCDGEIPEDPCTYLASTWSAPELEIDGVCIPCYKMASETEGWDAKTFWPESAREIIGGKNVPTQDRN